jgi:pilus assembly protein Flp/PilA
VRGWNSCLKLESNFDHSIFNDPGKTKIKAAALGSPLFDTGSNMILRKFLKDESGATAIEYGLIAALIAVVIITAVTAVGTALSTTFNNISGSVR